MDKEGKIATCVSLTPECKTLMKSAAKQRGISQSAVIEQAVREIVNRWNAEKVKNA